ncbi:MAG: deoxynucleoside kinase [Gammaproteobacteria bacterium]|nr:deoxynucleoside kinase [Gammaproteobacteria bacterium]
MPYRVRVPSYIVVEGPIGAGKTSLALRLAESFGSDLLLESAKENPFLKRFYKQPKQYALSTQLSFLLQRADQLQSLRQSDMFEKIRVADFLIEKDRLFAEITLDVHELALYDQVYAHLTLEVPLPNLVIYLQAPVATLQQRIRKRGIVFEQRIEDEYLQRLSDSYMHFFHAYDAAPLLIVNADTIDFVHRESDYQLLLEKICEMNSGRHYFNPEAIT